MSTLTNFKTADLCDAHAGTALFQIAEPGFHDYGGVRTFAGPISTVRAPEDNSLVRKALEEPGKGRVLVVDGGGSRRCALVGDQLALLAQQNGWAGVVVNGCIRDAEDVGRMPIGVKALGTHPLKSLKRNEGQRDVEVRFAGVVFRPGHYVYADLDGIVVSESPLS
ncbi:ribonuclease E activity regulator RraA [Comamonas sp. JC664]|uniref:ribonuclease E activity regulator RraA n=1 Tax=Comamonas sp. JC664 TaxID=2801917 RepID=UPI00174AF0FF|nr:ribonuclease E activity regulator RraA [Comamonas sp. JC664]MBL0695131.1 ribonuclease E activity regulator RraA [Comamonas sp. JC664]GHG86341.1 putative 4-hydroxy-4-methyl-2-oxoglutarate aldolase [Comamonas sp. KCTC 72670]